MRDFKIRISAKRSKNEYCIDNDDCKQFEMEFEGRNFNDEHIPIDEVKEVVDMMFEKLVKFDEKINLEMETN